MVANKLRGRSLERSKGPSLGSNDSWTNESWSIDDSLESFGVKSNVPLDFFKSWDQFLKPNSSQQPQTGSIPPVIYYQNPTQPNPNDPNLNPKRTKPKLRRVRSRSLSDIEPYQKPKPKPLLTNPYVAPPPTQVPSGPIDPGLPVTEATTSENITNDSSISDSGKD